MGGWLVVFGFNGPLRQYFSLYQAGSQRGERKADMIGERKKISYHPPPAPIASALLLFKLVGHPGTERYPAPSLKFYPAYCIIQILQGERYVAPGVEILAQSWQLFSMVAYCRIQSCILCLIDLDILRLTSTYSRLTPIPPISRHDV